MNSRVLSFFSLVLTATSFISAMDGAKETFDAVVARYKAPAKREKKAGVYLALAASEVEGRAIRVNSVNIKRTRQEWNLEYYIQADESSNYCPLAVMANGSSVLAKNPIKMEFGSREKYVGDATCSETACLKIEDLMQPRTARYLWLQKYYTFEGGNGRFTWKISNPNYEQKTAEEKFTFSPQHSFSAVFITVGKSFNDIKVVTKTEPCS